MREIQAFKIAEETREQYLKNLRKITIDIVKRGYTVFIASVPGGTIYVLGEHDSDIKANVRPILSKYGLKGESGDVFFEHLPLE